MAKRAKMEATGELIDLSDQAIAIMEGLDDPQKLMQDPDISMILQDPNRLKAELSFSELSTIHEKAKKVEKRTEKQKEALEKKAAKRKKTANPEQLFWACFLLAEAYFVMNRIPEALALTRKAKPISRAIDPSAKDPILGGLWRLAFSFEANRDSQGRQKGFAAALMALSWSMTRGLYRSLADSPVLDHLRLFLTSYGIGEKKWKWTVKHSHLTRHDFVGLLSILIHYTGLSNGAG